MKNKHKKLGGAGIYSELANNNNEIQFEKARTFSTFDVRLHRQTIEIHRYKFNVIYKEENLSLNKTWCAALRRPRLRQEENSRF